MPQTPANTVFSYSHTSTRSISVTYLVEITAFHGKILTKWQKMLFFMPSSAIKLLSFEQIGAYMPSLEPTTANERSCRQRDPLSPLSPRSFLATYMLACGWSVHHVASEISNPVIYHLLHIFYRHWLGSNANLSNFYVWTLCIGRLSTPCPCSWLFCTHNVGVNNQTE